MDFNHYFTNPELETILTGWARNYPQICSLTAIGHSYEKQPIYLLTLTDTSTGAPESKPAVWIDANIHATEVAGTTSALLAAHTLLTGFGSDPQVTRLLQTSVYYIVPRVNPDGAGWALAPNPRYIRSGVRTYPWPEIEDGLHSQDIDGDGQILQMRIPDPNGDWKISSLDPRLMAKREPTEQGGQYYRLLPEGLLENYDGVEIKIARTPQGLDFNRNFPFEWRTEADQHGAGPYPASEPEIKTLVDFIIAHPNINFAITFHTFSRVLLRPYSTKADDTMDTSDLWIFKKVGEIGTKLSGYRCVSTFHDFTYHPKEVTTGAFDDWVYDHLGIFTYTIELWDLPTEAGIKERKFIEWFRSHPHEEDLQILKWVDENAPGAYVDWRSYQHPQLGLVELGGYDKMYTWRNPPASFMGAEAAKHAPFMLSLGELLPRLAFWRCEAHLLESGLYHLDVVVENNGFLSTYTSEMGKKRQAARPVRVELSLPAGASLVTGQVRQELGHLEGRSNKLDVDAVFDASPTDNRGRLQWSLKAQPGQKLLVRVLSERAGTLEKEITLP